MRDLQLESIGIDSNDHGIVEDMDEILASDSDTEAEEVVEEDDDSIVEDDDDDDDEEAEEITEESIEPDAEIEPE